MTTYDVSAFAIGFGTRALINAGMDQTENRIGLARFSVTRLLGPLATLVFVFVDKKSERAP